MTILFQVRKLRWQIPNEKVAVHFCQVIASKLMSLGFLKWSLYRKVKSPKCREEVLVSQWVTHFSQHYSKVTSTRSMFQKQSIPVFPSRGEGSVLGEGTCFPGLRHFSLCALSYLPHWSPSPWSNSLTFSSSSQLPVLIPLACPVLPPCTSFFLPCSPLPSEDVQARRVLGL